MLFCQKWLKTSYKTVKNPSFKDFKVELSVFKTLTGKCSEVFLYLYAKQKPVGKVKIILLNESFIAPVGGKHNWLNGFKVHLKNIHDSLKFIFYYHKTTQNLFSKGERNNRDDTRL